MAATKEREILDSYREGTVSRRAVRQAIQKVKSERVKPQDQKVSRAGNGVTVPRLRRKH
jgi:hypothetical protein